MLFFLPSGGRNGSGPANMMIPATTLGLDL
jgi:hypothetical protein